MILIHTTLIISIMIAKAPHAALWENSCPGMLETNQDWDNLATVILFSEFSSHKKICMLPPKSSHLEKYLFRWMPTAIF
jgi:hypothetical protein